MISLSALSQVSGHAGTVVTVTTKRCRYQVWVNYESITIRGPGVDFELARAEGEILFDPDLSHEAAASMAVLFFEESNQ